MSDPATIPIEFDPFADGELLLTAPATEQQQEIWVAVQLGEDAANAAYNESITLRLRGRFDRTAFETSLALLVARHDALRTTFGPDGSVLCVSAAGSVPVRDDDLSRLEEAARKTGLAALIREEVDEPFDLEHGPLIRVRVVMLAAEEHFIVITTHHIICDGWSTGVLLPELAKAYGAARKNSLPELPSAPRFSDYAIAERKRAESAEAREDERYWLAQFADQAPVLELPTDRGRPAERTFDAARIDWELSAELVAGLKRVGQRAGASFVVTLLSAFHVFLHRLTGQTAIVVGMPAAGQAALSQPGLVGHCVNTLPIRADVEPDSPFDDYLKKARPRLLDAFDHQQFTFGSLLKKLDIPRDPSRIPLVSVLFNLDQGISGLEFDGLEAEYWSNPRSYEAFEWFVNGTQKEGKVVLETTFNTNLFDAATIRRRLAELETLLKSIAHDPSQRIGRLELLPADERALLLETFNATRALIPARSVTALIEAQVLRTPEAPAVAFGDRELSYAELDRRANRLARHLGGVGVKPGELVGLCLERSIDLPVAMLGIFKAGAAYVPLDPEYPRERVAFIVEDTQIRVLVSQSTLLDSFESSALATVCLDRDGSLIDAGESDAPPRDDDPHGLAYVIHTSGSTGKPKGVAIEHASVVNLLTSMAREPGFSATDTLLAVTTPAFDISVLELLLPLVVGGKTAIASRDQTTEGRALLDEVRARRATVMQATPATWRMLVEAGLSRADRLKILCGGEALSRELARELLLRSHELYNVYGPTETTIWSTCQRVTDAGSPISIGRPIANTQTYVLDAERQLVPIGVTGELYIGGAGVAQGYFDRTELTHERFVTDPFHPEDGARVYRSGDAVRFLADGRLEWLHRIDDQVKLRGFRIELGEIESVIAEHPSVRQVAVALSEPRAGDVRIVAYVVVASGGELSSSALREFAGSKLPAYMLPQHFERLDGLPLLPNGKVDRKALPKLEATQAAPAEFVAPDGQVATALARIWADVLGVARVGAHHDFFDLGGHSMLATRMLARARDEFGVPVPLRRVFKTPTLSALAEYIEAARLLRFTPMRQDAGTEPREEVVF